MIKIVLCFSIIINSLVFTQIIKVPDDKLTIQDAINSSNNGDTILVTEGLYAENINFKGKAITVASHYILDQDTSHISKTIIKGKNSSTVKFLSGESNSSLLMGFTIKNGSGISDPRDGFTGGYVGGGICRIVKLHKTLELHMVQVSFVRNHQQSLKI